MKDWIKLFCNSFCSTVYFGIAIIATTITLGAIFQILWTTLTRSLRLY